MTPADAVKLGKDTVDTVLAFADGKLDAGDLMKLGALLGDLTGSGLVDALAGLFRERIDSIDGLGARVID